MLFIIDLFLQEIPHHLTPDEERAKLKEEQSHF